MDQDPEVPRRTRRGGEGVDGINIPPTHCHSHHTHRRHSFRIRLPLSMVSSPILSSSINLLINPRRGISIGLRGKVQGEVDFKAEAVGVSSRGTRIQTQLRIKAQV